MRVIKGWFKRQEPAITYMPPVVVEPPGDEGWNRGRVVTFCEQESEAAFEKWARRRLYRPMKLEKVTEMGGTPEEAPDFYDLSGAQVEQGPIGFAPNEFKMEHLTEQD